ncbi:MAG: Crp/Fnr family transcriptional regulator [Fermentimonas sp.]|nr:Crp/Fnr family transcriptional regulator [Fermentimonas sp.]
MEKSKIIHNVYAHPLLTEEDLSLISSLHQEVYFSKGEYYLSKGEKPESYLILQSGLMRSFVYDYNGNDVTTHFFTKHQLVIEVLSLFKQMPSEESIQAMTDSKCWKIDFNVFENLFHTIPGLSEWGRTWFSEEMYRFKQRSLEMKTLSATDRYLKLLKNHPEVILQAPLKHIATYLGVTDTSLSRIRKEISKGDIPLK